MSMPLLTLLQATGGTLRLATDTLTAGTPQGGQAGLSLASGRLRAPGNTAIDSRKVQPGDLFWALPGQSRHGAEYIDQAFARGAAGVVTERPSTASPFIVPPGRWLIEVDDAAAALHRTAAWQRSRYQGKVVAVTGSVGKTTTRELIRTVLASQGSTLASPGNYNNQLGLPLSMLGLQPEHAHAVFELGASGPGEIAQLARLCQPHWAVITSLADAHLAGFGSPSGVTVAKTELVHALPANGCLVLNGDDPRLRRWAQQSKSLPQLQADRVCWVGRGGECDLRAEHVAYRHGQLSFRVQDTPFTIPVAGRHFLVNALAAIAVGLRSGLTLPQAAAALSQFAAPPLRCQIEPCHGLTVINDTYNACPASMHAALQLLRDTATSGRRIALCGDMLELGEQAETFHRQLGQSLLSTAGVDALFVCGSWSTTVAAAAREAGLRAKGVFVAPTAAELTPQLAAFLRPGDTLLAKASRALALDAALKNLEKLLSQTVKRHSLAAETLLFSLPVTGMKNRPATLRV